MPAIVPQAKYSLLSADVPTVVVNAAVGTGVGKSLIFSVQPTRGDLPPVVTLIVSGTLSVCTVTVLASSDGVNYLAYSTADTGLDANASKYIQLKDLVSGLSYQLSVVTFTGTSVTIAAVATS
jgi:hypothetical protein